MASNSPEQGLRREVRRLAAGFLAQRISHAKFCAGVSRAAVAAGVLEARRPTRDERTLVAMAWGKGTVEPGQLPSLLEPLFRQLEAGQMGREAFGEQARRILEQVKVPERRDS